MTAGGNYGKGHGKGNGTTRTNSHVDVGNKLTVNSGGDTNIKGGVVTAYQAEGNIGGDLNIESVQDTQTYDGKQSNVGAGLDVGFGNSSSVSLNGGRSKLDANHQSVTEQSGIKTGDGGFQIAVEGKTDLKGGVITSTQKAHDEGKNSFESVGGITTSDIENHSEYDAESISVSVNASGGNATDKKGNKTKVPTSTSIGGIGYGEDSDSQRSTTKSGITGIAGDKTVTTETATANALNNRFDKDKVQEELDAQVNITKTFDSERRIFKNNLNKKQDELRKEAEAAKQKGGEQCTGV